ncbi:MAG: polysulfide reductase NrfD [Candidatus Krumholzibacteria bacterium]|nr:polysulfide reductase NrfD [Candidatus Krumholzibacteria bacterium]
MVDYLTFVFKSVRGMFSGGARYRSWLVFLMGLMAVGGYSYYQQAVHGLGVTGMGDQVSWGLYIANFTFLVGVAAAAVMMVIPGYLYHNKEVKGGVLLGEMVAIGAIVMCLLFVVADLGRPDRMWHMIPPFGKFNFPVSMLAWDVLVLNGYLLLNLHVPGYLLYKKYKGEEPAKWLYLPFVYLSIVWAISIHTVTAFLYTGLAGRPYWNAAILAPRFIASAFCAGPAFIILVLEIIKGWSKFPMGNRIIGFLRGVVLIAGLINVFLLISEIFTEFYADSAHVASARYLFFGLHGHNALVPWIWTSITMNVLALLALISRKFEKRGVIVRNIPLLMLIMAIWIEKGMGLVFPGFIPTPLGEIVEYMPSANEWMVSLGIWGVGLFIMTVLLKHAVDIETGVVKDDEHPGRLAQAGRQ